MIGLFKSAIKLLAPPNRPEVDEDVVLYSVDEKMPYDWVVKSRYNIDCSDMIREGYEPINVFSERSVVIKRQSGEVSYGIASLYTGSFDGLYKQNFMFDKDDDKITHWGLIPSSHKKYFTSVDRKQRPNFLYAEMGLFDIRDNMKGCL